jgi:hypothetical protein
MDYVENTASIVKEACLLIRCLAMDFLFRAMALAGMCLPSRCLAMGIHVTTLTALAHSRNCTITETKDDPTFILLVD